MVELKGSLSGIGLPAIIQLIGELHHSGQLELTRLTSSGELGFDDGHLVSATFGDERGLNALAACSQQLADAEFRFVEGPHIGERTIDIGPAELQRYLDRLVRGESTAGVVEAPNVKPEDTGKPGPCPLLGFADDPSRHYSRPTALHRCFAAGSAGLVTGQEQRELCLTGRYPTCPRYRNASPPRPPGAARPQAAPQPTRSSAPSKGKRPLESSEPGPSATPPGFAETAPARSTPPQPPPSRPAPPPTPPQPAAMPAAVAARMAAAGQLRLADGPPDADSHGFGSTDSPDDEAVADQSKRPIGTRLRNALLLAVGGVLGLLVLAGVLTVAVPALEGRLAQRSSNPNTQAFEPVPTAAGAPTIAASATNVAQAPGGSGSPTQPAVGTPRPLAATSVAAGLTGAAAADERASAGPTSAVAAPRSSTAPTVATTAPTVASSATGSTAAASPGGASATGTPGATGAIATVAPTAVLLGGSTAPAPSSTLATASTAGESVVDVLFSAGPSPDWVDNPPFASWSAGAYRLDASLIPNFVAVGVPIAAPLSDVIVSATFRKTGGPPGGGYGVVIRDQGPPPRDGANQNMNAYVMETGDVGEFGVWRRDGDHWVDIVPWTHSSTVRVGGSPNELTVQAIGAQLTFTVNGTEVAKVDDDTLPSGGVGVFVGGDNNEVALDHFAVQIPTD